MSKMLNDYLNTSWNMLMMQILTQTDNHDLGGNVATNKKWSLKKKQKKTMV